jgi:hypothetical protein
LLGLHGASKSAVMRVALALFHGKPPVEAIKYAALNSRESETGHERIVFDIPEDLKVPEDVSASWATRVGLGIAMGMTRADAEYWAESNFKPTGRPVGITESKPRARRLKTASVS